MQRRNVTCDPFLVYNPRMVDQNMPWSLKGISDEAREFAKMSADQSDVPVGAWLSQVIRTAAGTAGNAPDPAADPVPAPPLQQAAPQVQLQAGLRLSARPRSWTISVSSRKARRGTQT